MIFIFIHIFGLLVDLVGGCLAWQPAMCMVGQALHGLDGMVMLYTIHMLILYFRVNIYFFKHHLKSVFGGTIQKSNLDGSCWCPVYRVLCQRHSRCGSCWVGTVNTSFFGNP